MKNRYGIFLAMIGSSIIAMFIMTYLNSWEFSHVFWSETRAYMVIYMGSIMALIMLFFMRKMFTNKIVNISIIAGAIIAFSASLYLVRSQSTIDDKAWMQAMIPHHSIAILTSERANISDPRVQTLADEIIKAQKREIAEMKALISDLETGPGTTAKNSRD